MLREGEAGGRRAAQLLNDSIKNQVKSIASGADQWTIVVYVFANVTGLVETLVECDIIDSTRTFDAFITGFNSSNSSFHFVNAGYGKNRADYKIIGQYRHSVGTFTSKINKQHNQKSCVFTSTIRSIATSSAGSPTTKATLGLWKIIVTTEKSLC